MSKPIILDGKKLAKEIEEDLKKRVEIIKTEKNIVPCLATILVGDDASSKIYVGMKIKACARIGMNSKLVDLPKDISTEKLIEKINYLNSNPEIFGILLQHPVPKHIDERACFDSIILEKDVDGVSSLGFGKMAMGEKVYGSATPAGIIRLLDYYEINIEGKHAVVVGRSPILGKPMAMMFLNKNATTTICHSKTNNLERFVKKADILVGAVGKKEFIKSNWIKDNAVVIDAGYHKGSFGDIEINENTKKRIFAYTPIPGGVGPMTISTLISQSVESAERRYGIKNIF